MKTVVSNIIIIVGLLISINYTVQAAYRENYLFDEEINYYFMEVLNLKIGEIELKKDEFKFEKLSINFQIEDRYYQDQIKARFINGWNTSFFLGEFESNQDYLLRFRYKGRNQSYKYEINFNILLIDPIENQIFNSSDILITYKGDDLEYNSFMK